MADSCRQLTLVQIRLDLSWPGGCTYTRLTSRSSRGVLVKIAPKRSQNKQDPPENCDQSLLSRKLTWNKNAITADFNMADPWGGNTELLDLLDEGVFLTCLFPRSGRHPLASIRDRQQIWLHAVMWSLKTGAWCCHACYGHQKLTLCISLSLSLLGQDDSKPEAGIQTQRSFKSS